MNRAVKKYIKEVKLLIPLQSKDKKEFISMVKQRINDSQLDNYNDIVDELGRPTEIAASFLNDMDTNSLVTSLRKRQYTKIISIVLVVVIFITGILRIYYLTDLYNQVKNGVPVEIEDIIEEE